MIAFDTDVLTIIQRRAGPEYERLVGRLAGTSPEIVFVSIVTFEEQMRGWLAQSAKAKTRDKQIAAYTRLHQLLRDYANRQVLDFDDAAADQYHDLVKAKVRIGTMDLRIAAITKAHDATLISRNLADFRQVPGLRVEDWTVE